MLAYFERTLSWQELLKRTYKEMMDDDALGLAAQLASPSSSRSSPRSSASLRW